MTAKEYLEQYRRLKIEIDSKTEQLEELREFAKSVSHSSGAGGHAGVSDKVGKTVAKIIDLENEISCQIDKLLELKKEIESTIAKVDDPVLRQLLTLRYINGRKWEQISNDLDYSRMQIHRLHENALEKVKNVIECYIRSVL